MPQWKIPPEAKIYEALSAVADGRVSRTRDNEAGRIMFQIEQLPLEKLSRRKRPPKG